ncbi:MAG: methyltransferase domain-containing protein [Bacteroidota bacterium]
MHQDVPAYYNQTQNHYKRWWQLDKSMALHYGLWYKDTTNFTEALENTNKHLASLANIVADQKVLDAGCGVGGSAIYLAKNHGAHVTGITLSDLQVETAKTNAIKHNVGDKTEFTICDYANTHFKDNQFDLIWACESSSSAPDKVAFARECYRLLKPGGKLVLSDFFRTATTNENNYLLDKWVELWAMSSLVTNHSFAGTLEEEGFEINKNNNLTKNIIKTVKKMYLSYLFGAIPAILYNLVLGARKYSKYHYKSGFYQYKSLKQGLWEYRSLLAIKPKR